MSKQHVRLTVVVALGLLSGQGGYGQESAGGAGHIEPAAKDILRRMSAYLAGVSQLSFEAHDMLDHMDEAGQKIQLAATRRIAVRRPDRISGDVTGDMLDEQVRYDGKTLTILDKSASAYCAIDVPGNIDAMLGDVAQRYGIAMPLADLLANDPYQAVADHLRLGHYVGIHDVRGVKCHHLAFRQESIDWQIWIEDGERPLPRKLVITHKTLPGQPQYIAIIDKWNLSPQLTDQMFVADIPKGTREIDLTAISGEPGSDNAPSGRPPRQDGSR